ncbi:MAG: DUF5752 family protein [Candidatus Omnitrophica bacterium]|nr:DUF5752 family protein [Candidatus Omnitrophota bacterium]
MKEEPFRFYSRLNLSELTGIRAATLLQLAKCIKQAPDSCIYHHTHRYLQIHQHICPEPPNDFAYWVSTIMKEEELAEKLTSIDVIRFPSISELRKTVAQVITDYVSGNPKAKFKFAKQNQEFHFIKSVSFIFFAKQEAYDLKSFLGALQKVTISSIYFHMFESKIRLGKESNDFSFWLAESLGEDELAHRISSLDPYAFTMEGLRFKLIALVKNSLK